MKNLFVISAACVALTGCSGRIVNQGEKVGSVIKVSSQGYWNKTNEVEIVRGGINGGSGAFSTTPLHATIADQDLLRKAQNALDQQYEVKVKYDDYWCYTWLYSESDCVFLTSIEPLKAKAEGK
jgi:hypothetical protein